MLLAVFVSVLALGQSVLGCEDGVDNVLHLQDTMKGKGAITFNDIQILTYDKEKNPSCSEGKGVWHFPGFFKVKSGSVSVNKKVSEKDGQLTVSLTLEKNSWIVGSVCEKGKSKNSFVPNEMCNFPVCKFAKEKCDLLGAMTGTFDLTAFITSENEFIDVGPLPVPQVAGEWQLSAKLMQGKKAIAGLTAHSENEWLTVEAEEMDLSSAFQKQTYPGTPHAVDEL